MSPAPNRFCTGLDLGRHQDFSALALLQWYVAPLEPVPVDRFSGRPCYAASRLPKPVYEVPTLKRWPLGTSYSQIIDDLIRFFQGPALRHNLKGLVVDATGVGDAVYEMLFERMRTAQIHGGCCAVTITAGSAVTLSDHQEGRWHVAKKQLVSILQVLLGNRRLQVAENQPEAKTLLRELGTFTVKITDSANETFESWRERDHDDLVLAVALAAWGAETLDLLRLPDSHR